MIFNRLFFLQCVVLLLVAGVHIGALQFSLYWHFVWLDVLTHFLGGVWVAAAFLWVCSWIRRIPGWGPTLLVVLGVGIGWEVFELAAGIPRESNYVFDTSIDLGMDMLGGLVGYLFASRLSSSQHV